MTKTSLYKRIISAIVIGFASLTLSGCWESDTENAVEDVGEKMEESADDAGDAIENTAEEAEDGVED